MINLENSIHPEIPPIRNASLDQLARVASVMPYWRVDPERKTQILDSVSAVLNANDVRAARISKVFGNTPKTTIEMADRLGIFSQYNSRQINILIAACFAPSPMSLREIGRVHGGVSRTSVSNILEMVSYDLKRAQINIDEDLRELYNAEVLENEERERIRESLSARSIQQERLRRLAEDREKVGRLRREDRLGNKEISRATGFGLGKVGNALLALESAGEPVRLRSKRKKPSELYEFERMVEDLLDLGVKADEISEITGEDRFAVQDARARILRRKKATRDIWGLSPAEEFALAPFHQALKMIRISSGLGIDEIANLAGIKPSTLQFLEQPSYKPGYLTKARVVNALKKLLPEDFRVPLLILKALSIAR